MRLGAVDFEEAEDSLIVELGICHGGAAVACRGNLEKRVAIASAVAHATGNYVRTLPITPEKALHGDPTEAPAPMSPSPAAK